jgi:hypothetical protein
MHSAEISSIEPDLAKPDGTVSKIGWSKNSKNSDDSSKTTMADPDDWRTPLVRYLESPSHIADTKV